MEVEELAARVREKVERQRRELENDPRFRDLRENERFLARLEEEVASVSSQPAQKAQPSVAADPEPTASSLRRLKAGEKAEAIVLLLRHHGRQTPKDLRNRMRDQGIDPDAGTEVKRVLWQLAQEKKILRDAETSEYSLPGAALNGSVPASEELRL